LRLNDPTESDVNRRLAARVPDIAGRGISPPGAFFQFVLPRLDGRDSIDGLREAQEETLTAIVAGWTGRTAPPVRLLPHRVEVTELAAVPDDAGVPIGLAEDDLATVAIGLDDTNPHFLVYGDAGSGKSTVLKTLIKGLTDRISPYEMRAVVFDYRHSLLDVVPEEHLGAYAGDATTAQVYVEQVVAKLTERIPPPGISQAQLQARDWWEGTDIYVVIDDYDLLSGASGAPLNPLAQFIPQSREVGLHIILARRISGISRSFGDPLSARIRDMGTAGLILSGDHREGVVLGDERAAQRPPGRGVLVQRSRPNRLIQVATP
jgi:DNA segregation ATPase FtsK/SpoIIIE, S-DNA-T family